MTVRTLSCLALLSALALGSAQSALGVENSPVKTSEKVTPEMSAKWSEADHKAARERDEARHQHWETKMKALTKGICIGC